MYCYGDKIMSGTPELSPSERRAGPSSSKPCPGRDECGPATLDSKSAGPARLCCVLWWASIGDVCNRPAACHAVSCVLDGSRHHGRAHLQQFMRKVSALRSWMQFTGCCFNARTYITSCSQQPSSSEKGKLRVEGYGRLKGSSASRKPPRPPSCLMGRFVAIGRQVQSSSVSGVLSRMRINY